MKSIALAAMILTVGTAAEAQTIVSRQVKSQPVETVVTRQPNGTLTTSSRIMNSQQAAMRTPQRIVRTPVAKPQRIVYRTIVREVVRQPEPQMVVVREPVTRWVPSILPPFSYPVTSYEDRVVYTTQSVATPTTYTTTYSNPTYATLSTSYPRPMLRTVVDDEDEPPVVRAYAPASYVIRY